MYVLSKYVLNTNDLITMRGRLQGRECPANVTKHIDWKLPMLEEQYHISWHSLSFLIIKELNIYNLRCILITST